MRDSGYYFRDYLPPLYSARAIFYFTVFGGPLGIALSLLNARRLEENDLYQKSLICLLIWLIGTPVVFVVVMFAPESRHLMRFVSLALEVGLGYYLQLQNEPHVQAHLEMGGQLKPVWVPLVILLAFFFGIMLLAAIAVFSVEA
ncbi:hypothetical protein GBSOP10_104226 [Armatimonadetes bacterium GBS]|jgi:hypothetical protein|nr:hypothetical protein HRbin14_00640 [bacterium HR14]GIV14534.1 MAG: hypothetical protein KatS3mg021_2816 [Fimbriimonadales bacterium]CUU05395.1 hypothetical protein GBSOP10_104226 [Armatimonadetes bacterium GBS]CUU33988.1 hypothetical protein GXSOP10_10921 [Armatimonadetes bacterium GXS]